MNRGTRRRLIVLGGIVCIGVAAVCWFHLANQTYSNEDFGITSYRSESDADGDGLDDQTDVLKSAREYIATKPRYKSKYYSGGYPDDGYGVCTDVVAFALKNSGYDLMELVNEDVLSHSERYEIDRADKNIDFRRVKNLRVYFDANALSLSTDLDQIDQWQGGDIVVFENHIGIVSDKRNRKGVPYLIHNGGQPRLEEDVLHRYSIVGHYRLS